MQKSYNLMMQNPEIMQALQPTDLDSALTDITKFLDS
jgi:hypothetical protein